MTRSVRTPRAEDGFTLIELLVVVFIIAVLSAIALPAFLNQRAKAQDAAAKSDARTVVTALESCYTEISKYDGCPDGHPGATLGTAPGQVALVTAGDTYSIVSYSRTGNTFTVVKTADQVVSRSCTDTGYATAGCHGGQW